MTEPIKTYPIDINCLCVISDALSFLLDQPGPLHVSYLHRVNEHIKSLVSEDYKFPWERYHSSIPKSYRDTLPKLEDKENAEIKRMVEQDEIKPVGGRSGYTEDELKLLLKEAKKAAMNDIKSKNVTGNLTEMPSFDIYNIFTSNEL